jgi:hypothetical protein
MMSVSDAIHEIVIDENRRQRSGRGSSDGRAS